jgi:hypothetical protein
MGYLPRIQTLVSVLSQKAMLFVSPNLGDILPFTGESSFKIRKKYN